MPLLDKETALKEVRERFEEVIVAHLQDDEDEDEEVTREECGEFIDGLTDDLIAVVDEIFSRARPH